MNWFWDFSWRLEVKHINWKHTTCVTRFFFLLLISHNFDNLLSLIFNSLTGLLFYAEVEIHQVRRLVSDNYQKCTVPLNEQWKLKFPSICFKEVKARMCQDTLLQSEPIHHYFKCEINLFGTYRSMCKHEEELSSCSFTFTWVPLAPSLWNTQKWIINQP